MQFEPAKLNQELEPRTADVVVNELKALYETEDGRQGTEAPVSGPIGERPMTDDRGPTTGAGPRSAVLGLRSVPEDIIIKVRGLNGNELAAVSARRDTNVFVEMLSEALVKKNGKDGGEAIKGLLGLFDDELHPELKYRVEIAVKGAVEPRLEYPDAVRLARDFYVVLHRLSEKVLELSGLGSQVKKKSSLDSITTPNS